MTLRKLPTDDRRVRRLAQLISDCLWQEIRSRHIAFDLDILTIKVTKDLRNARLLVSSDTQSREDLMAFLESVRIPTQSRIAQHRLRHTPVLSFLWDEEAIFLHRILKQSQSEPSPSDA